MTSRLSSFREFMTRDIFLSLVNSRITAVIVYALCIVVPFSLAYQIITYARIYGVTPSMIGLGFTWVLGGYLMVKTKEEALRRESLVNAQEGKYRG